MLQIITWQWRFWLMHIALRVLHRQAMKYDDLDMDDALYRLNEALPPFASRELVKAKRSLRIQQGETGR